MTILGSHGVRLRKTTKKGRRLKGAGYIGFWLGDINAATKRATGYGGVSVGKRGRDIVCFPIRREVAAAWACFAKICVQGTKAGRLG